MNDGTIVASGIVTLIALVIIIVTFIDKLAEYMEKRRQEKQRLKDDIEYNCTQLNEIKSKLNEVIGQLNEMSQTKQK